MSLIDIIRKHWSGILPENVIFLAVYKQERYSKYPSIQHRYFNPLTMDWFNYKKWMKKEEARQLRILHNQRVSESYKPQPPQGS